MNADVTIKAGGDVVVGSIVFAPQNARPVVDHLDRAVPIHCRINGLDIGEAVRAMKRGERVARAGWNGKGMWLAMTPGSTFKADSARSGAALHVANVEAVTEITVLPHIDMRAADGSLVIGWLASQTDLLAEDWEIVS